MILKDWRKSNKMTGTDAAALFGISQASLSRFETGEQWPDPETLEAIVKKTGISATDLHADFLEARRSKSQDAA